MKNLDLKETQLIFQEYNNQNTSLNVIKNELKTKKEKM